MAGRLIFLAILGVGALYVIHLLAQDYQKIRRPAAIAAKLLFGKRDLNYSNDTQLQQETRFDHIDWEKILRRDPFNCALSLICQIVAGAEKGDNEANAVYEIVLLSIEHNKKNPQKLLRAFEMGQSLFSEGISSNYKKCYAQYPLCPYSARTMLKLMKLDSYLFGDDV